MVRIIAFISLVIIGLPSKALETVVATIDKNPVMVNESFVLEVIADDSVEANALDTSKLHRDFIVGTTSVSQQTQMINFKTKRETRWTTVLIARKPGTFVIPSLPLKDKMTNPIKLEVVPVSAEAKSTQELYIETEISDADVYVQQQMTLTVKLYSLHDLKRGSLTEPVLADANIQQIGKDIDESAIVNGKRFRVIKRTYAISPQQSGNFTLEAPVFTGEIYKQGNRSVFSNFSQSKPVSAVGESIEVTVKPIPTNYQGDWLPAEIVTLTESWQTKDDVFKVGEPISRTITLTAAGLSEEQLPELPQSTTDGIKVYPEQANSQTSVRNGLLISQKVQTFALVVSQPGQYELPEMSIPWWNTRSNKMEFARLPAKVIDVAPGELTQFQAPEPVQQVQPTTPTQEALPKTIVVEQSTWQWVFFAAWLLTSLAWFISSRRAPTIATAPTKQSSGQQTSLFDACRKNEGERALAALLPWATQLRGRPFRQLTQWLQYENNAELIEAVEQLQSSCYSKNTTRWQGDRLKTICLDLQGQQKSQAHATMLSLNPQ